MKKLLMMCLCTALLLCGCAAEEAPKTLAIGLMPDVGAAPFIIAKEMGYFEEEGLDVTIEVFKSAQDRDTAFQTGNLDGVMSDFLALVFFNDNGFPVKATSATYGNYRMVTSPEKSAMTLSDLRDISVGLSTNTVIEFATDMIVDANDSEGVEKVAIPKIPLRLEMLKNNEIDVATLPEPLASAAVLSGGVIVTDSLAAGYDPGVFLFSDKALEEKGGQLEGFYEAYDRAVAYLNTTEAATYFPLLVEKLSFPPVLEGQFDMPTFKAHNKPEALDLKVVNQWLLDKELTTNTYTLDEVLYEQ